MKISKAQKQYAKKRLDRMTGGPDFDVVDISGMSAATIQVQYQKMFSVWICEQSGCLIKEEAIEQVAFSKNLCHPADRMISRARDEAAVNSINEILFPKGDPDHEWNVGMLEQIADVIHSVRPLKRYRTRNAIRK